MEIPTTVGTDSWLSGSGESQDSYFRLLFEKSPLPMWVIDTKSRRFLLVNDSAVEMYGYARKEFLQMTVQEVLPPKKLLQWLRNDLSAKKNTNSSGEKVHLKKDGTLLYVVENSKEVPSEEGEPRQIVVIQNITSRKQEEQQLHESETRTHALLKNMVEVVFSFNAKMEMTYVSPQCLAVTGYTPEQFYAAQFLWFNLIHPKDRPLFEEKIQRIGKSGELFHLEHRIRTASGEEKWVLTKCATTLDQNGRILRLDGSIHDITLRKRVEERFRFADFSIERSAEPLLWTRGDGQIVRVNRAACNLLGYHEEELLGLRIFDISPTLEPEAWPDHWQAFEQLQSLSIETVLQTKNGRRQPVEMHWSQFSYSHESYGFITIREIAERKNTESEKTVSQIQHLQQFVNIVSHNLRSPVANIVGLTSLYNHQNPSDPNNAPLIEKLEKTALRLEATIQDLNKILAVRNKKGQLLEVVDLEQELQCVLDNFSIELASCQAVVDIDLAAGNLVLGVKGYVHSIFFNLISNAIKYRSPCRGLEIKINTVFSNGLLCLQVRDNGLGLDLKKLRHEIFGLYRRFHPTIEGKGLGLHMSKTQIESIGGKIEVESTPDTGTTFNVFFQVPAKL